MSLVWSTVIMTPLVILKSLVNSHIILQSFLGITNEEVGRSIKGCGHIEKVVVWCWQVVGRHVFDHLEVKT